MSGPFFHQNLTVPKHIRFKSFADPSLLEEYKSYLSAYLDRFGDRLTYMLVHAEGAETYFNKFPDQIDDYRYFLSVVRSHIKRHNSRIKVGVLLYPNTKDHILRRVGEVVDYTAYDLMKGKLLPRPSALEELIQRLIGLADGKSIAIQNAGLFPVSTNNKYC